MIHSQVYWHLPLVKSKVNIKWVWKIESECVVWRGIRGGVKDKKAAKTRWERLCVFLVVFHAKTFKLPFDSISCKPKTFYDTAILTRPTGRAFCCFVSISRKWCEHFCAINIIWTLWMGKTKLERVKLKNNLPCVSKVKNRLKSYPTRVSTGCIKKSRQISNRSLFREAKCSMFFIKIDGSYNQEI